MTKADMCRAIARYLNRKQILFIRTTVDYARAGTTAALRRSKATRVARNADFAVLYHSPSLGIIPVWLKLEQGAATQTPAERDFRNVVLAHRHLYVVVKSVKAVEEWFQPHRNSKKITKGSDSNHSGVVQSAM